VIGYTGWLGTGIFYGYISAVMIDMLILQTIFLTALFAVVANIRWRRKKAEREKHA
jgi:hypothetical protein